MQARESQRPLVTVAQCFNCFEIGAGAEGVAIAGQDHHSRLIIGNEAMKLCEQRLGSVPVDCIAPLRALDADNCRGALALIAHQLLRFSAFEFCHAASLCRRIYVAEREST